jgi:excisionase family DNA binding protein
MSEKLYAPYKAAEMLGVTTKTLKMWEKAGKIRCVRTPGGHRRIPESEVHRLQGVRANPQSTEIMYKVVEKDGRKVLIPL